MAVDILAFYDSKDEDDDIYADANINDNTESSTVSSSSLSSPKQGKVQTTTVTGQIVDTHHPLHPTPLKHTLRIAERDLNRSADAPTPHPTTNSHMTFVGDVRAPTTTRYSKRDAAAADNLSIPHHTFCDKMRAG